MSFYARPQLPRPQSPPPTPPLVPMSSSASWDSSKYAGSSTLSPLAGDEAAGATEGRPGPSTAPGATSTAASATMGIFGEGALPPSMSRADSMTGKKRAGGLQPGGISGATPSSSTGPTDDSSLYDPVSLLPSKHDDLRISTNVSPSPLSTRQTYTRPPDTPATADAFDPADSKLASHYLLSERSHSHHGPSSHGIASGPTYQPYQPIPSLAPARERKPFQDSEAYWLGLYFFFNLGLTLFNKIVLVSFPFPYTLTGLHALSGCAGCYIALERGSFTPAHLTSRDNLVLAVFSVLYTINIAVSNLSLQLVTVPFHQVVRAATPLFTIFISVLFLRAKFSGTKILSLLPVIAGVGFATYGDYNFTTWGLILTLFGTALAALKTVITNLIQTGGGGRLKLHPLDLLMRMSPLAFIQCVVYGWWSGELERVRKYGAREMSKTKALALVINGTIAFGLNVVSFSANKETSALTMTVAANVKQVLTIVLAVIIFDLSINPINALGILLTLLGGAAYAYIEFEEKAKKTRRPL